MLARLAGELDRAEQGRGGLVFVGGESGAGKTHLAAEVAREATVRGVRVVAGECVAVGAPLHPFRRLLEAVCDRCRAEGRAATDRILGPRGKILAAYDPSIARLPGQDAYPIPARCRPRPRRGASSTRSRARSPRSSTARRASS